MNRAWTLFVVGKDRKSEVEDEGGASDSIGYGEHDDEVRRSDSSSSQRGFQFVLVNVPENTPP